MRLPAIAALVATPMLLVTIAGCGGGSSATEPAPADTRAAAAPATACNPLDERRSYARSMAVTNLLPVAITMAASEVNCAQWSGVSTPYGWNGVVVPPGETVRRRLEMAKGTVPAWTFTITTTAPTTPFRVKCVNPDNPCGYDVFGAPAGAWPDSVVIATDAAADWAATPEQRAAVEKMPTDQLMVWSDGAKVYVFAHTGDPREITDSVT